MKAVIKCFVLEKGKHTFYVYLNGEKFYLFTQNYRKSVHNYFKKGVLLCDALNFARVCDNNALCRTVTKLTPYLKYVEQEYGVAIFEQTKQKQVRNKNHKNKVLVKNYLSQQEVNSGIYYYEVFGEAC